MTDNRVTDNSIASALRAASSPASLRAFVDELVALGHAQAAALEGQYRGYLLSHFQDKRILAGELRLVAEYAHWIPRGATVLDWGCGPALPSLALRRFRPDLSLKAANFDTEIQAYPMLWSKAGVSVDPLRHQWLLPYPDDSLDVVISKGVLEHVPHEQFSLGEIFRVLRHGGKLIVTGLPAYYSLVECFNRLAKRPHHARLYTLGGTKRLLLSCGFQVIWSAFRCATPLAAPWADPLFEVWERMPLVRHLTQNIAMVGIKSAHGMADPEFFSYKLPAMLQRIQSEQVSSPTPEK
jgi:SAM-dependent methyltransferase